jgi:hypothetical protein
MENGFTMFVIGSASDDIEQFSLLSAWNISTATHKGFYDVGGVDGTSTGIFFKTDMKKIYISGSSANHIYQFSTNVEDTTFTNSINIYGDIKVDDINATSIVTAKEFVATERLFDDLRFPALTSKTTGASNVPDIKTFINGTIGFTFDDTTMEQMYIVAQFPHTWKEGTTVYPHFHYSPLTSNTGDVVWCMEYTWANIDSLFPSSSTSCVVDSVANKLNYHLMTPMITISGTGKTYSSIMNIRIYRNASDSRDTLTGDILLHEFDIHHEVYRLGNRQ